VLVTALAVVTRFRSTPHHSYYGGDSALRWVFLGRIIFFLSIPSFWLDDVIMTSPALLTDVVLASLELLVILVGVAFIQLGGVKLVFTTVSLILTIFQVLSNPTPYSE
jgi:hypothetical protein